MPAGRQFLADSTAKPQPGVPPWCEITPHDLWLSRGAPGPRKEVGSRKAGKEVKSCSPVSPSALRGTWNSVPKASVTCPTRGRVLSGIIMILETAVPLRSYNPILDFTVEEISWEREGSRAEGHEVGWLWG